MKNKKYTLTEEDKLYTNNTGRKSFQWELWQYCNSLCDFCYLGKDNRVYNKERQHVSLNDLNKAIDNLDFNEYNNISLIGGEFFQGQLDDLETHDLFFKTIKKIFQLYVDKKIGSIWITCTLTIGNQKHLYELMEMAHEMKVFPHKEYGASGLWLCTSWDTKGRFHSEKMKNTWEYHIKHIKELYPWIKFNTTIILQKAFIEDYLNNKFKPKEFMKEFHTTLFFKQCGVPPVTSEELGVFCDEDDIDEVMARSGDLKLKAKEIVQRKFEFFPTRKEFIRFLIKFHNDDIECFDRLFNIMYRADELHRNFLDRKHDDKNVRNKNEYGAEENGRETLPCGHTESYAPYIDSNHCCICDRNIIAEEL